MTVQVQLKFQIFESSKGVVEKSLFIWGDHEFDCYENESFKFLKNDENRLVTIDEYDIFFLTPILETKDYEDILNKISSSDKVKVIFTHNVIFSKIIGYLELMEDYYDLANQFYDELPKEKDLTIVAGDVGAIKGTPYLTYYKKMKLIFYPLD